MSAEELPLEKHEFLDQLDDGEIEALKDCLERREIPARRFAVGKGDPGDELFLLVKGEMSILADTPDGHLRRLAALSRAAFRRLAAAAPALEAKLLHNLLRSTSRIIGRLTVEVLGSDAGGARPA